MKYKIMNNLTTLMTESNMDDHALNLHFLTAVETDNIKLMEKYIKCGANLDYVR